MQDKLTTIWVVMLDGEPNDKATHMLRACMLMALELDQQQLADKVMEAITEHTIVMTEQ